MDYNQANIEQKHKIYNEKTDTEEQDKTDHGEEKAEKKDEMSH